MSNACPEQSRGVKSQKSKVKKGFTLVEMLVALGIFVLVSLMLTNIFITVIQRQRGGVALQNAYDDLRFGMELMAREFRTGGDFEIISEETINCTNDAPCLKVENQAGEEVRFYTKDKILHRMVGEEVEEEVEEITSRESVLKIERVDGVLNAKDNEQERVAIIIRATPEGGGGGVLLQTTVSSRKYR